MTIKRKTLWLVRYFPTGAYMSRGVGYKGRLVAPERKRAIVKRLRKAGIDAFAERFMVRAV